MYDDFFEFERKPFNVTPDPDFIFYSDQHKEALAHMLYGVRERRGFLLVTGRVGSGKTTLCRAFLRELDDDTSTALILNSNMGPSDLIETIAEDFGVDLPEDPSDKDVIDRLNDFLLESFENDRNACVVVDESQNLSPEALEQLRLLSNLETDKQKLLQIVLVGQPELENMLNRPELRQLKQRIAVRTYLSNLDEEESREYVLHRIDLASRGSPQLEIQEAVFPELYEATEGNPRAINLIGDRMLMAAFVEESRRIDREHLRSALDDLSERVNESEEPDSLIIRRLTSFAKDEDGPLRSTLEALMTSPVALVSVAALVTVLIGTLAFNNLIGTISVPTVRSPSANSLNDFTQADDASRKKRPEEAAPTVVSDTDSSTPVPTPVDEPGTAVSKPDTPAGDVDASRVGTAGESAPASTPAATTPDSADTGPNENGNPETNRLEDPLANQFNRAEPPGAIPVEPLQVDERTTDLLTRSRNLSINRLVSLHVSYKNITVPDTLDLSTGTLSLTAPSDEGLRELLSLQTVSLQGGRDELLGFGLPVLVQVRQDRERYVLYLPDQRGIWDPLRGWLREPGTLLPEDWTGSGEILAQAPFDLERLMRFQQSGSAVRELQRLLNGTGRYDIPLVGNYGPMTRDRVGDFQEWQGLPRDEIGGPRTYLALLRENDRGLSFTDQQLSNYLREVIPSDVADQAGPRESRREHGNDSGTENPGDNRQGEEWGVF